MRDAERDSGVSSLVVEWVRAGSALVFTGAGMSAASGIATFRGPSGLWTRFKPVYFDEFMANEEARLRHWEYKLETWTSFRDARPNNGHLALAELDRLGWVELLVTQNIDGLHLTAGHSPDKVVELHGTNAWVECVACGARTRPDPVFEEFRLSRRAPLCSCGGFLKPATVSFGQAMPAGPLSKAAQAAQQCRLVLAVGSTLEVTPAASIPLLAKTSGAFYAIVNQGPTAHDHLADLRLDGDASQILKAVLAELLRSTKKP